jgi:hypothetical protein
MSRPGAHHSAWNAANFLPVAQIYLQENPLSHSAVSEQVVTLGARVSGRSGGSHQQRAYLKPPASDASALVSWNKVARYGGRASWPTKPTQGVLGFGLPS